VALLLMRDLMVIGLIAALGVLSLLALRATRR